MKLIVHPSRLRGKIAVPGSKSHTIRAIATALLTTGEMIIKNPLQSADTISVLNVAAQLGLQVVTNHSNWRLHGPAGNFKSVTTTLNLGNSGTGLCILTALAATQRKPYHFDGDASLRSRSMHSELQALTNLGARCDAVNGKCPYSVCGPLIGGETLVDGSNSQYLTALLFAAPLALGKTKIQLRFLREQPYVAMTLSWLRRAGIKIEHSEDLLNFQIAGQQCYQSFTAAIPADFSTAAFPLAAAALIGDGMHLLHLDFNDVQGDKVIFDFARQMGVDFRVGADSVLVQPLQGSLRGGQFDLNACPDTLPVMAVLAALADGETRLFNVAQARQKETDRIACMASELRKMGCRLQELDDGLLIQGGQLRGAELSGHGDHRLVMALAVAAMAAEGASTIAGAEAAAVTYPDFVADFQRLGAKMEMLG